ncbi:unnamed protein product [Spirodela intermedia]|uniref:Protein TIFY n=1 Tax=Spirodela intermedia TaxID=51605 RepID=A0A7I8KCU4_SPIIN|nr:unnamed protein product [Spirodela intermedia]
MEASRRRPGERATSNFSTTCRKLSQYLKEKGGFGEVGLSMSNAGRRDEGAKDETRRTMNLLPGVTVSSGGGSEDRPPTANKGAVSDCLKVPPSPVADRENRGDQMTIFYGGKVVVFDNFPADKARELMALAVRRQALHPPPAVPRWLPPPPHHHLTTAAVANMTSTSSIDQEPPRKSPLPASSDLPIARRVSLHRFLEKRKDRIISKGPYQFNSPSSFPSPARGEAAAAAEAEEEEEEAQRWLALEDLRR